MSQSVPQTDPDLPIWDTPLHDAVDLADCTLNGGRLVIMHPESGRKPDEWLESNCYVDTYDAR